MQFRDLVDVVLGEPQPVAGRRADRVGQRRVAGRHMRVDEGVIFRARPQAMLDEERADLAVERLAADLGLRVHGYSVACGFFGIA